MRTEEWIKGVNNYVGYFSLIAVLALGMYVWQLPNKLAYVNTEKLINEYKGMQDAKLAYQKKTKTWQANVDTLTYELQQQIISYEKAASRLTANEKKLTEQLIQTKQRQLGEYQNALKVQAQQEDEKLTGDVLQAINLYLKKYGAENKYKIVMAATGYGNIAYADEGLDITNVVLEGLNAEYSGR